MRPRLSYADFTSPTSNATRNLDTILYAAMMVVNSTIPLSSTTPSNPQKVDQGHEHLMSYNQHTAISSIVMFHIPYPPSLTDPMTSPVSQAALKYHQRLSPMPGDNDVSIQTMLRLMLQYDKLPILEDHEDRSLCPYSVEKDVPARRNRK